MSTVGGPWTKGTAALTGASATIVAADTSRTGLILLPDSAEDIWYDITGAAAQADASAAIQLTAGVVPASWTQGDTPTSRVTGITGGAAVTLTYLEQHGKR